MAFLICATIVICITVITAGLTLPTLQQQKLEFEDKQRKRECEIVEEQIKLEKEKLRYK